jgi:enediyne biosynthesis protein E4
MPAPSAIPWSSRRIFAARLGVTLLICAGQSLAACRSEEPAPERHTSADRSEAVGTPWFVDAAAETGLTFRHVNGMSGEFYYPEIIGPGVALFDFDNDGDLDVFLIQGGSLGPATLPSASRAAPPASRLYRNDLAVQSDGTRTLRFADVTEASGIKMTDYGMGAAVGDYNNDGCADLYVTAVGRNQLFRNNCDGTFTESAARAGVVDSGWSVSAAFVDFDRDGWLDLYVGHYLDWDPKANTPCFSSSGRRAYCAPRVYRPQPSRLYHNNRDGTFTDVTASAGMATKFGPALGVASADFNGDGWIDLYVANDGQENQLWLNQRDGTFRDTALLSGVAVSEHGKPKAGMGVDAGDFDDDGDEDLIVTNLSGEGHDLYVNDGSATFDSRAASAGLRFPTLGYTGFGTAWFDFDNDGWLDILTVNGTVQWIDALARAHDPLPLRQRKQLFHNLGNQRFEDLTSRAGPVFQKLDIGRGAAFGDIDNDGDTDVVVGNNNGEPQALINTVGARNHWLGLRLVGRPGESRPSLDARPTSGDRRRDMLGARVAVIRQGQRTRWRRARADGSYASANDPRVLVGLGASREPSRARVIWPDGRIEEWSELPIDRYTTLEEGGGK